MYAVGVLQDCWPGLGSHGMIVLICSPAPCFQEEGPQALCLPLLHTVFQITHMGSKRLIAKCWHCCTAISEAPFSHIPDLCSSLSSDGCIAAGEKVRSRLQLCMGPMQSPIPCVLLPELLLLYHQEGGLRFTGIINIYWFN